MRFLQRTGLFALTAMLLLAAGCGASTSPSTSGTTKPGQTESGPSNGFAVPAVRDQLTTSSQSPVVHDNEIMALAPQSGRLFAATDQWEYSGPSAYGQILVKNSPSSSWKIFEQTQSTRVQALDSFPIPSDQGLGPGHSLLVTQAIVDGRSEIQWLIDGATSFAPEDSFALASSNAAVRSFGAHEVRRGVGHLRRCRTNRNPAGDLVTDQPHAGLQPGARAEWGDSGFTRVEDTEGYGVCRLWWCSLRHHQHQVVPQERRLAP